MEDMSSQARAEQNGGHAFISKSRTEWRTCFYKQEQNRMEDMFSTKSRTEWRICFYKQEQNRMEDMFS